MPRNKTGGKKSKKGKNDVVRKFITISKEDKECQKYAVVERALGNNRFELKFLNGDTILGIKRKAIKRNQWINAGATVIVSLRDYQKDKCDIIHLYTDEESRKLRKRGIIVEEESVKEEEENPFEFEEEIQVNVDEI
jgi:translation initiation factor 1A